jgi:hypothetical protein
MKNICRTLLVLVVMEALPTRLPAAEYYKLENIKRIEKDLYRSGKILVVTRFCFHLALSDTAILRYEGQGEYSDSKIIWDDDSSCDVSKVISE